MRVLLDTHVLYWAVRVPTRLSSEASEIITDSTNELLVSVVTPWEMGIKHRKGRFPDAGPFLGAFAQHLARLRAHELPITGEHSLFAGQLEWSHRDPFDRMLAAQAIIENAALVSADGAFASLGGLRTAW